MEPGAYVFCRPINDGPAAHQFIVLVPSVPTTLSGWVKDVSGTKCSVLGAYNEQGYLRARLFAESDVSFLRRKLQEPSETAIQSSKIELQACLIGTEDPFLACICRAFARYRSYEGTKDEIPYPGGGNIFEVIKSQLSSSKFNSNSWAQSLVFWSEMVFVPGKCIRDFRGLDVGNDRLIPRRYFLT